MRSLLLGYKRLQGFWCFVLFLTFVCSLHTTLPFGGEMSSIDSDIWTLGSQLVPTVWGGLRNVTLVEEVCHYG